MPQDQTDEKRKAIVKIKKLLALSKSNSEHEAALALSMAEKMMAKYKVSREETEIESRAAGSSVRESAVKSESATSQQNRHGSSKRRDPRRQSYFETEALKLIRYSEIHSAGWWTAQAAQHLHRLAMLEHVEMSAEMRLLELLIRLSNPSLDRHSLDLRFIRDDLYLLTRSANNHYRADLHYLRGLYHLKLLDEERALVEFSLAEELYKQGKIKANVAALEIARIHTERARQLALALQLERRMKSKAQAERMQTISRHAFVAASVAVYSAIAAFIIYAFILPFSH